MAMNIYICLDSDFRTKEYIEDEIKYAKQKIYNIYKNTFHINFLVDTFSYQDSGLEKLSIAVGNLAKCSHMYLIIGYHHSPMCKSMKIIAERYNIPVTII